MVEANLRDVQARIAEAARRAGRDPSDVRLVGVTKGVGADRVREALDCGLRDVGENRVQEAREKKTLIGSRDRSVPGPGAEVRWHLIGHLQRNKAGRAVELFDVVHSVDSPALAEALAAQAARRRQRQRPLEVLIQVNVSGEATKHGCRPEELLGLARSVLAAEGLRFSGLMTMAPFSGNPEDSRACFRTLRELRAELERTLGTDPLDLSMGMTRDFEVAIEEGATLVRIGTAIFGERKDG